MAADMTKRWQDQQVSKVDGEWVVDGRPNGQIIPAYQETPSNLPGKTVVGLRVVYPPNGATPPHYHGGAAVFATMIRGKSCMQTVCPGEDPNGQGSGRKIFGPGESWHEPPGCHHVLSSNASEDEECEFIATLIADTERIEKLGVVNALVVIDAEEEEKAKAKV